MLSKTQTIRCYHWPIDSGLALNYPRFKKDITYYLTTVKCFLIDKYIKEDKWLTIKKSLNIIYAIVLLIIGAVLKWIFSKF